MKKIAPLILASCSLLITTFACAANETAPVSPVGYWKTIDDVTGKPKGIVQITETSSKTLSGKILKIFPRPGFDQKEVCSACEGEKHNQQIVGMVFLDGLKQDKENASTWAKGKILDPLNGKMYQCKLNLTENNQKLNVKGYIGIPLFGRSQTWVRVTDPEHV